MNNREFDLEDLRNLSKLSQEEVAKKMGISRRTYFTKENGDKRIYVSEAYQLANIFGCDVMDIIKADPYVKKHGKKFKTKH